MDAEQKKRAREAIDGWNSNKIIDQAASAYGMAELLRELIEAPDQAAGVPVCRVSGYFGGYLTLETIDKAAVLPNGMALYAAPQAPAVQSDLRDAERLNWLLRKLPGDALRYCVGVLSDTSDEADFRFAIDAARAAQRYTPK